MTDYRSGLDHCRLPRFNGVEKSEEKRGVCDFADQRVFEKRNSRKNCGTEIGNRFSIETFAGRNKKADNPHRRVRDEEKDQGASQRHAADGKKILFIANDPAEHSDDSERKINRPGGIVEPNENIGHQHGGYRNHKTKRAIRHARACKQSHRAYCREIRGVRQHTRSRCRDNDDRYEEKSWCEDVFHRTKVKEFFQKGGSGCGLRDRAATSAKTVSS
jgi:hypothetical protein